MTPRTYSAALALSLVLALAAPVAHADCTAPTGTEGQLIWSTANHQPQYCNGGAWIPTAPQIAGGGSGCLNPAAPEGQLLYNSSYHTVQFCNGTSWVALSAPTTTTGSGCSNPSGVGGQILYNSAYQVLQHCDTTKWNEIGTYKPTLAMDFSSSTYSILDTSYGNLSSFLTGLGGTFSRSTTGTYVDASGVLQSAAINTPRIDYDPMTLAPRGLLIEESRTNSIRNSTMVGAAVGVWPTKWSTQPVAGITMSVVGTGTEDGIPYIDVHIFGTATAATSFCIFTDSSTAIAATNGDTWSGSTYFRLLSGSLANFRSAAFVPSVFYNDVQAFDASGNYISESSPGFVSSPTSAPLRTQRGMATGVVSRPGMVSVHWMVLGTYPVVGAPIDATIRIGAPQLEWGKSVTSFIPTTTAVATRGADSLIFPSGVWYSSRAGTWAASFDGGLESTQGTYGRIVASGSTRSVLGTDCGSVSTIGSSDGATSLCQTSTDSYATSTGAAAVSYNNLLLKRAVSARGAAPKSGTFASSYAASSFALGSNVGAATNMLDGHIGSVQYYPVFMPDNALQSLPK